MRVVRPGLSGIRLVALLSAEMSADGVAESQARPHPGAAVTDTMTQADADQLEKWVESMSTEQLRLLWKWLILAWAEKAGLMGPPPRRIPPHP